MASKRAGVGLLGVAVLVGLSTARDASAQLFGTRPMGRPMTIRPQAGGGEFPGTESVGTLTGRERFLRGNRTREDFVGGSRQEQRGFVGREDAIGSGRVRAATETLRPEADDSRRINRPLPAMPPTGMYYPRIELSESLVAGDRIDAPGGAAMRGDSAGISGVMNDGVGRSDPDRPTLDQRLSRLSGGRVAVVREGDRAVLRGTVASREEAERAELILSFEPGVYEIRNELRVAR